MNNEVQNQFEKETGKDWMVIPVTHGEKGYASWEYQLWIEAKVKELKGENERLREALERIISINAAPSIDELISKLKLVAHAALYPDKKIEQTKL